MGNRLSLTVARRNKFLQHVSRTGNIGLAAKCIGLDPRTIYTHRKKDPAFDAAVEEALFVALEALEAEAYERAMGKRVEYLAEDGSKRVFYAQSDKLLELLLKGNMGHKYGSKTYLEVAGKDGKPLFSEDPREKLASLLGISSGITIDAESSEDDDEGDVEIIDESFPSDDQEA